ncbi:MAG TPA: CbiX/SirB N-terminal domain-containing protein [Dermatophilaceae bacterium]
MRPALVAVAHGTRDAAGPQVIAELLDDVRRRLPGVEVITAWVELVAPGLHEVMSGMGRPAVVVPLLLSTGHHFRTDVPAAAALSEASVHVTEPLGPHRHLARAMTARLREAGALRGDAVVLAASGSGDPAGLADVEQAAALLRAEWGPRVTVAYVSADGPDVHAAVEHLRQTGADRVCVAPYLLAPGRFSRRVTDLAAAARATAVAPVLGHHELVTDLVVRRYKQGLRALTATPHNAA